MNFLCIFLLFYLFLFFEPAGSTAPELFNITDTIPITTSYRWTPGGRKYPTENSEVVVTVDDGYYISVTIINLDLYSGHGDFLSINSGDTEKEDESKTRIFTYYLKKSKKILCNSAQVKGYFYTNGTNEGTKAGVDVLFERLGTGTTTTQSTTSEIPRPTADPNVTTSIDVTISGRSDKDYDNKAITCLKNVIAGMAKAYCYYQDIKPIDDITEENVVIKFLKQCTYSWPNFETCVLVNFEIPIFLADDSNWTGYQLTADHLRIMWSIYSDEYLAKCGLEVYKEPNIKKIVKWWLIGIGIATVGFVVVLLLLRKFGWRVHSGIRRRRLSDNSSIISEKRESTDSCAPHHMQETPQFFENFLPMYKPGE